MGFDSDLMPIHWLSNVVQAALSPDLEFGVPDIPGAPPGGPGAARPHEADRRLLRTEAMRSHLGHWVPCACILR